MGPWSVAQHLLDAIDASLTRLQTDYVDLTAPYGLIPQRR